MKNTYNPSQELLIKSYEQFKVFFKSGKKSIHLLSITREEWFKKLFDQKGVKAPLKLSS